MARSKCAFGPCMNLTSTSGRHFFRFPQDDAQRQSWLDSMGSPMYKPARGERLCADHFAQNCFSDESRAVLLGDAVPTLFDPTAFSVMAVPPKSTKPAPKPSENRQNLTTTYLKHPLSSPVTVTLPPSSRLILLPGELERKRESPQSSVPHHARLPAPSSTDTVTAPANCARVEEQPRVFLVGDNNVEVSEDLPSQFAKDQQSVLHIMRRKNRLAAAKKRLAGKKKRFHNSERRLAAIKKILFSERTLYRDGKKIVEISLSRFAEEVLDDSSTEFNNGEESGEPSTHATSDTEENSNSLTSYSLWDDEGNAAHVERVDVPIS